MDRYEISPLQPGPDRPLSVIRYGHRGRPVVVFPTSGGRAADHADRGMVDALSFLIDAGRIKLYRLDSLDHLSWSNKAVDHETRARHHDDYERWVTEEVVRSSGRTRPVLVTCSPPAAASAASTRSTPRAAPARPVPVAIANSGAFDPSWWNTWGMPAYRPMSTTPCGTSPISAASTSTGSVAGSTWSSPWARALRERDRLPPDDTGAGESPAGQGDSLRARRGGVTTQVTTGRGGSARSSTTCLPVLLTRSPKRTGHPLPEDAGHAVPSHPPIVIHTPWRTPVATPRTHLIGLLLGARRTGRGPRDRPRHGRPDPPTR